MTDRRDPKCRKCGKGAREIGGWLGRVNATGQPGIWECRPDCEADLPPDDRVVGAILDGDNRQDGP